MDGGVMYRLWRLPFVLSLLCWIAIFMLLDQCGTLP
jgi:hypothetical protein